MLPWIGPSLTDEDWLQHSEQAFIASLREEELQCQQILENTCDMKPDVDPIGMKDTVDTDEGEDVLVVESGDDYSTQDDAVDMFVDIDDTQ
mmetsp:Transcript_5596/g.8526  ORF Transcript_5596/g.8526 Transcript_5596/m.8526 type:complete len:91 (+) Transcript_5596:74-346(+)